MITSANTSVNKRVPAIFKKISQINGFKEFSTVYDCGAGKYPEYAREYLNKLHCTYYPYDPYNLDNETNFHSIYSLAVLGGAADIAILSNVLNVIEGKHAQISLIRHCFLMLNSNGVLYANVYEGDKSGNGRVTKKDCWQENRRLKDYVSQFETVFPYVEIHSGMIIAHK